MVQGCEASVGLNVVVRTQDSDNNKTQNDIGCICTGHYLSNYDLVILSKRIMYCMASPSMLLVFDMSKLSKPLKLRQP